MRWAALLACAILVLVGCRSKAPAPIYDRTSNPYKRAAESTTRISRPPAYVVRRGDTLYAIAWRYGLDFRELARWNGIGEPYTIFVGDTLKLKRPRSLPPVSTAPGPVVTAAPPARSTAVTPPKPAASRPAASPAPNTTTRSNSPPAVVQPAPVKPPPKPRPQPAASGAVKWRWPADGPLLSSFSASNSSRKGIDIGGKAGDPIRAAAGGEIVYSGSGLVGYGELIIIKHDDRYLSAYGHNRKRLVSEGDRVEAGAVIAEMGDTGADRPMLHFEIRDNGQPKDPVAFLPKR